MADKKLKIYKDDGSGELDEDPDNYARHFPNIAYTERVKKLPTNSQKGAQK